MACFEITLADRTVEVVDGADAYQQEGPMTTFFQAGSAAAVLDSWSTRLVSVRSSEVLMIRRRDDAEALERSARPLAAVSA